MKNNHLKLKADYLKYVNKRYVKRGKFYFGSGKVQRRSFFPLLAAASRFIPIISLAREILDKGWKKYMYIQKNKNKNNKISNMLTRDNIIPMKRERPKAIELPEGRTFCARYKWVTRNHLPTNIRMRRWNRQKAAPRNRCCRHPCQGGQRGWGLNIGRTIRSLLGF